MKKLLLLLFVVFLLLTSFLSVVSAVELGVVHNITLLSVTEMSNGDQRGDLAFLYLQLRSGTGSVFLESFPATKIDTQVSTRVANEVACSYSTVDCSKYDFFYTIKAGAPAIGGPSAGGAISILTLSALESEPLKEGLAMTGAISSGGVLMPVDGIREKVKAAEIHGYSLVVIPELAFVKNISNTTNLSLEKPLMHKDFENNTIEIINTYSLKETFTKVTKNNFEFPELRPVSVPLEYDERMMMTADKLCSRTLDLFNQTTGYNYTELEDAHRFYNLSLNASEKESFYPMASFCYSANIVLREKLLDTLSNKTLLENLNRLNKSHFGFEETVDSYELETFSDLETYSIVKERLLESRKYIDDLYEGNITTTLLASAIERYNSAVVWSGFFGMKGDKLDINSDALKNACNSELQNVYTRNNYLQSFMPGNLLIGLIEEIGDVMNYAEAGEYELCLFKASKAKAYADYLITGAMLEESTLPDLVNKKQKAALEIISEQQDNNVFPILGYSYYEYSKSLEEDNYYSALMFAENSIAFSDLSNYFEKVYVNQSSNSLLSTRTIGIYLVGVLSGLVVGFMIFKPSRPVKTHMKRKSKRK